MGIRWPSTVQDVNRLAGKFLEEQFIRVAQLEGLWARKSDLSARMDYRGKPILLQSPLDFRLINREGKIGFYDCKNIDGEKFSFSALNPHQIAEAAELNSWGVSAGFVVLFRAVKTLRFYSGRAVQSTGPGKSFLPEQGFAMGSLANFTLRPLLEIRT